MSLDAQILGALRAASGGVSGAELAAQFRVTRAAVWSRIQELRILGYGIEASPHLGYRLVASPDVLHADDLKLRLGRTRVVGREIRVFQETTSTNDVMEKIARDGVAEGIVVFAEKQTRGRGRLGRRWHSPRGLGLYGSVLFRPEVPPMSVTRLTIAAAVSMARAIELVTGLRPEIKWPNDLLLGGRKVAGILTEMNAEMDRVRYAIVGLGVDVNHTSEDFPPELRQLATSLRVEGRRLVSRGDLALALLRELDRDYARAMSNRFEELADEWEARCTTIGQQVAIQMGARQLRGRAESLDTDGALLLRTEHGHLERVVGGDVTLEK
ncbi:MAG: biotin--[acetyl-CoA-carboxylase] ligase [Verrucomicrobia bacterium]|nr:biotin--[acetyl-CoA-carboxylase] ligase [Verrucomicrobiota bacterium]